jgi:hypothetical protein
MTNRESMVDVVEFHTLLLLLFVIYRCTRTASPEKKDSMYLCKCENLNFKEKKSPISNDNREKTS